jgi:hypothetical protein
VPAKKNNPRRHEEGRISKEYVPADEINGLVKEILNVYPKTKQGLQFLVRKEKSS